MVLIKFWTRTNLNKSVRHDADPALGVPYISEIGVLETVLLGFALLITNLRLPPSFHSLFIFKTCIMAPIPEGWLLA